MQNIKPQVYFSRNVFLNRQFLAHETAYADNPAMTSTVWISIKAALDRLDQTQDWLAEQVGVSNHAVTKWKQKGEISRENAKKVSALLSIPLDNLLTGEGNPVVEVLEELPLDTSTTIMRQIMYQIEHAHDMLGREKATSYVKAMDRFIKDMEKRRRQ